MQHNIAFRTIESLTTNVLAKHNIMQVGALALIFSHPNNNHSFCGGGIKY